MIASACWVFEIDLAAAGVWETIADIYILEFPKTISAKAAHIEFHEHIII